MKISKPAEDIQTTNGNGIQKDESIDTNLIQTECIDLMTVNGLIPCTIKLSSNLLSIEYKKKLQDIKKLIAVEDIVGCNVEDRSHSCQSAFLSIIAYRIRKSQRKKKSIKFIFNKNLSWDENYSEAVKWENLILNLNYGQNHSDCKPLLFIVNPKSGRGRALKIFDNCVKPLLIESKTNFELKITEHANHALELMRDMEEITRYHGVVVVSGDGLLYEVVNGLTQRKDTLTSGKVPISLGIIPGGSGNGLAHAVNQAFLCGLKSVDPIFDCTLHVTRGRPLPMDLIEVITQKDTYYSFLSLGWGLMADIDIESERLRMLGEPRFTIWSLFRSFALRKYHAKLSYLPADSLSSTIPPLDSPLTSDWVTIEDNFVQIYSAYQTHISSSAIFAPKAKLDDGVIWLQFIRSNVSRTQVVQFLLGLEKGKHVSLPFANFLPVKAFRIEPTDNVGRLTVDGELIECGPAQAQVIPKMATILSR